MKYLNMDRQVCVIKTVAYRTRTDTQTDKKVISFTLRLWSLAVQQFKPLKQNNSKRTLSLPLDVDLQCVIYFSNYKRNASLTFHKTYRLRIIWQVTSFDDYLGYIHNTFNWCLSSCVRHLSGDSGFIFYPIDMTFYIHNILPINWWDILNV